MATSTTEAARATPNGSMHDISLDGAARLAEKQRGVFNFLTWPFILAQALAAQEVLAGASRPTFVSDEEAKAAKSNLASPLGQEALFREPGALRGDPASEPADSAALSTEDWDYTGFAGRSSGANEGTATGGNAGAGAGLGTNSGPFVSGGLVKINDSPEGQHTAAWNSESELIGLGSDTELGANEGRVSGESLVGTLLTPIAGSGALGTLAGSPVGTVVEGVVGTLDGATQLVATPLVGVLGVGETILSGSAGAVVSAVATLPEVIIAAPSALVSAVEAIMPVLATPAVITTNVVGDVLELGAPLVQSVVPAVLEPVAGVTEILSEVLGTGESVVEAVLSATGSPIAILSEANVGASVPLVQSVVPALIEPVVEVTPILGEVLSTGESVVETVLAATGSPTPILSEAIIGVSAPLESLIPPVATVLSSFADPAELPGDGVGLPEAVISNAIDSLSALGSQQAATTIVPDSTDSVLAAAPLAAISDSLAQTVTDTPATLLTAVGDEPFVQTVVPALIASSDASPGDVLGLGESVAEGVLSVVGTAPTAIMSEANDDGSAQLEPVIPSISPDVTTVALAAEPLGDVLDFGEVPISTAIESLSPTTSPQAAPSIVGENTDSTLEAAPSVEMSEPLSQPVTEVPPGLPLASDGSIDFPEEVALALPVDPLFSSGSYTDYGLAIAGEAPATAVGAALPENPLDADGEEVAPASGPQPQASAEPEEPPPDDEASAELQPQVVPVVSALVSDLDDGWMR